MYYVILTKNGQCYILGDFITNSIGLTDGGKEGKNDEDWIGCARTG
jgi:hypothetical protein